MQCLVGPISLQPHPTAANLRIGTVAGHQVVVGDHYDEGTLGFFIPDGAIVPDKLAEEMWLKGRLAGNQKNRVKARQMHGVQSDGLFYGSKYWTLVDGQRQYMISPSWNPNWVVGQDVAAEVGVM